MRELPRFIEQRDPLSFIRRIDARPDRTVLECLYFPKDTTYPRGLGEWPISPTNKQFVLTPQVWVSPPSIGEVVVTKIGETMSDSERSVMIKLNGLFPTNASARHALIYGYGWDPQGSTNPKDSYLIMERVPEDFEPLSSLMLDGFGKDPKEAGPAILELAKFLAKIHSEGIVHGDLLGLEGLDHYYFSPKTLELRIIDWDRARLKVVRKTSAESKDYNYIGTLSIDHDALWYLVHTFFLDNVKLSDIPAHIQREYPSRVASILARIYQNRWIDRREGYGYSHSDTGTARYLADIQELANQF